MLEELIESVPLTLIFLGTIVIVLVAIEMGYRIGRSRSRSNEFEGEAQMAAIVSANLALLAFIMAFSFSQAASHHQTRKELVVEEASAIGTAYLRASLVSRPEGAEIQRLLEDYTELRVDTAGSEKAILGVLAESYQLQDDIWRQVEQLAQKDAINLLTGQLVQSLNDMFDIQERRIASGGRYRVSSVIWLSLGILLTLSMLGMGYFQGVRGRRSQVNSTTLALSFSLVLLLIADLDRPLEGFVQLDQSAISELDTRLFGKNY